MDKLANIFRDANLSQGLVLRKVKDGDLRVHHPQLRRNTLQALIPQVKLTSVDDELSEQDVPLVGFGLGGSRDLQDLGLDLLFFDDDLII